MSGPFSSNLIGGYTLFILLKSTLTVLYGLKSTSHFLLHLSTIMLHLGTYYRLYPLPCLQAKYEIIEERGHQIKHAFLEMK